VSPIASLDGAENFVSLKTRAPDHQVSIESLYRLHITIRCGDLKPRKAQILYQSPSQLNLWCKVEFISMVKIQIVMYAVKAPCSLVGS